jgi:hypothetical protein
MPDFSEAPPKVRWHDLAEFPSKKLEDIEQIKQLFSPAPV